MLTTETEIVLANLDWLMAHAGMRLDYSSRAVLSADGDPVYLLDDLADPELTPAGKMLAGRLPIAICYTASISSPKIAPPLLGEPCNGGFHD